MFIYRIYSVILCCAVLAALQIPSGGYIPAGELPSIPSQYSAFNIQSHSENGQTDNERQKGVPLVIVMYHAICPGRCEKYVIPPKLLEEDLKYLKDNGYAGIKVADLINFQEKDTPLPEKPVVLTFDDGNRTNYIHAFPLLKKYDMKAVMAVVGAFTDSNYKKDGCRDETCKTYLTYAQMKEMAESGLVEIQNHSYDLHKVAKRNGMKMMSGETFEEYERVLKADLSRLEQKLEENAGIRCTAIAFPFGAYTKHSTVEVVKKLDYKASLTCNEGVNYIHKQTDLFMLKRYNRAYGRDITEWFK